MLKLKVLIWSFCCLRKRNHTNASGIIETQCTDRAHRRPCHVCVSVSPTRRLWLGGNHRKSFGGGLGRCRRFSLHVSSGSCVSEDKMSFYYVTHTFVTVYPLTVTAYVDTWLEEQVNDSIQMKPGLLCFVDIVSFY